MITHETRRESYDKVDSQTRQRVILDAYSKYGDMTARECARLLGYHDLNAVKPRITELCKKGQLVAVEKRKDPLTDRNVAVFRIVDAPPQMSLSDAV